MARLTTDIKAKEYKGIAEEASFQLTCSKEFTGWMVSLMKAIQLDREHEMGSGVHSRPGWHCCVARVRQAVRPAGRQCG